jgi:hypothetical protein
LRPGDRPSVKLAEQTIVDNPAQSTLRQKVVVQAHTLTEAQLHELLAQLFERARQTCRKYALEGVSIFVYRASDDVSGASWLARLDTTQMIPKVDVRRELIARKEPKSGTTCVQGKALGKSINWPNEVVLPPLNERKVIGTWEVWPEVTMSIEEVRGNTYSVLRSKYCESGSKGTPLTRQGRRYMESGNSNGKYYVILPSGELAAHDRQGYIESYEKQSGLWARR